MGKSTINGPFSIAMLVYQRVITINDHLVSGKPAPLKNMTSSVGMMKFTTEWKNESHVPNHQPAIN